MKTALELLKESLTPIRSNKLNDKYNGNPYGRNMVADYKPQWGIPHLNINSGDMSTGQMRKVGTLVVTKIKGV